MKMRRFLKRHFIIFLCSLLTLLSYSFIQPHIQRALGADTCTTNSLKNVLTGTDGDDVCSVPNGDSNLTNYRIFGLLGNDTLTGGGGQDNIFGGFGDDNLYGRLNDDQLFGDIGNDRLFGGNGNDKLYAGIGDDDLSGENGDDNLSGDLGQDNIDGGSGKDQLDGGADDDAVFGGNDNDTLKGGTGNDTVVGGYGEDTLTGYGSASGNNPEIDTLIGGGNVTFDDQGNANVDIFGDGVKDIMVLGDASNVFYAQAGSNDYAKIVGFEKGVDQLQLSPTTTYTFGTDSIFSALDTLVFANRSNGKELIAIVVGVNVTP